MNFESLLSPILLVLEVLLFLMIITAFVKMIFRVRIPENVVSGWNNWVEGLVYTSEEFYTGLERELKSKGIPGLSTKSVTLPEGGMFSAQRKYLRVKRKAVVIDICAAPFATGFFFSYWVGFELSFIRRLFCSLPFVGRFFLPTITYYHLDTASMFRHAVQTLIKQTTDEITSSKGLRNPIGSFQLPLSTPRNSIASLAPTDHINELVKD